MRKKTILLLGIVALILLIIFCNFFKAGVIREQSEAGVVSPAPLKKAEISASTDTLIHKEAPSSLKEVSKKIKEVLTRQTISFKSGTAGIDARGRKVLDRIYDILKQRSDSRLTIIGHTDSFGNEEQNRKLSIMRAEAVRNYLKNKGLNRAEYTIQGMGSTQPVASNRTKQGRVKNRRVEIILEGE